MNKKFKWIFINGGLGWGVPFAFLISVLRWIENKPSAFGSFLILIVVSLLGGIAWGYFTYKDNLKNQSNVFSISKFLKSMSLILIILCIYGFIFRYLFVPNNLDHTLWSTGTFILLIIIGILIQNKFILKESI